MSAKKVAKKAAKKVPAKKVLVKAPAKAATKPAVKVAAKPASTATSTSRIVVPARGGVVSADDQKKAVALAALEFVKPGMKIGIGTGSTANHFIDALAAKVKAGLAVECVSTSRASTERAQAQGIKISSLNDIPFLDCTFDGADEFDSAFRLIKGGGGALLIEKMVASSSRTVVTLVDASKRVAKLGKFPLPVEVVAIGVKATAWKMERVFDRLGMKPKMTIRMKDGQPFRTDAGNVIIDCACGEITDPDRLEIMLNNLPGVVNNGLFIGISGIVLMGHADGSVEELRRA